MKGGLPRFVEERFGICMVAACAAGLFAPGLDRVPTHIPIDLIAVVTYFACFKIRLADITQLAWRRMAVFYACRFLLLPVLAYMLLHSAFPMLGLAALLFFLLPAGLSTPAFAMIHGSNVALAMALSVSTNLLLPFALPAVCLLVSGTGVAVDAGRIFFTLSAVMFLPVLLYAATRNNAKLQGWTNDNGKWLSLLLVLVVIAVAIAPQRAAIFVHPGQMVLYTVLSGLCYALAYVAGWLWPEPARRDRITLSLASGANNAALGISLSLLYFPPDVRLFMVAGEISWGVVLTMFNLWLNAQTRRTSGASAE